ncbi:hypothetical protein GCM10025868_15680 [Angustibacter aerolatus]|uniref:NAD(P)-binding domain-containing protein n=1 Tax=Angustibacter aerolatus TaxID=1162965 RepID=A0ABQ6JDQ6_9ACTN|nr:hypothetical protein GCM10025868_15680 [Angustibacter aerolatus]
MRHSCSRTSSLRGDVDGTGTLISIDKARRLLGYEPEHSWRDHAPLTDTV